MNAQMVSLIQAAALAPSGHNTQPWKFEVLESAVRICPDFSRRLPVVDPEDRALFISLGCATENFVIAAAENGLLCSVRYQVNDPKNAYIEIAFKKDEPPRRPDLFAAITERRTNRNQYDRKAIPAKDLEVLCGVKAGPGTGVRLITSVSDRKLVEDLILKGDRIQFSSRDFKRELAQWVRFNSRERKKFRDGLSSESTNNPSVPRWLGSFFLQNTAPHKQAAKDEVLLRSSSALAVVWSEDDSLGSWMESGRTFERFALTATSLGIQHAHMNQAVEVASVRAELRSLSLMQNRWPQLIVRLGYAHPAPPSDRRALADILPHGPLN